MKDLSRNLPTFQLRRIAACNLLKYLCLEDKHSHGEDQFDLMYDHFGQVAGVTEIPDQRTWKTWLAGTSMIKDSKLDLLDAMCQHITGQDGTIKALVQAWPTDHPDRPRNSPIHLHFDALDAAGFWGGTDDRSWAIDKQARAETIFRVLHNEWNPKNGPVYSTFKSDLQLKLDSACEGERERIRDSYARFRPDPFERALNMPPKPDLERQDAFELVSTASVWKFLFGLSKDFDFLVDNRLDRWALDLATASAAMYAYAFSNRYDTFGSMHPIKETLIVAGTTDLFWEEETDLSTVLWRFGGLLEEVPDEILLALYCRLWEARESYWELMSALGISPTQIKVILHQQWVERPIVFAG